MYIVKGFLEIKPFIDNSPGEIATLGELSTYSRTYTREIGYYSDSSYPYINYNSFHVHDGTNLVEMGSDYSSKILEIMNWIYTESSNHNFSEDVSGFIYALTGMFSADIENIEAGQMVEGDETGVWLPQFVVFTISALNAGDNYIQTWFVDNAFREQYDEYEIFVVPPLDTVDDLIDEPNAVSNKLGGVVLSDFQQRIEFTKNNHPSTTTRVETFTWVAPADETFTLSTHWGLVIYGAAGNNIDAIRLALEEYVLNNTVHDRSTWEDHIPGIFISTEFLIIPLWSEISIPNQTEEKGLFSPSVPYSKVIPIADRVADRYPSQHVMDTLYVSGMVWRNLSFLAVGNPENAIGAATFKEALSDYIMIPTTSVDFSRMSAMTQSWVNTIISMAKIAEDMTDFSSVPLEYTRMYRNDLMYLVSSHNGIQYLMLSKQSYDTVHSEVIV